MTAPHKASLSTAAGAIVSKSEQRVRTTVPTSQDGNKPITLKPRIFMPSIFMMDLLATVPYYTAYLSRALMAEGAAVTVGSISYYLDPECFSVRRIRVDPGISNIVGRHALPRTLRRGLKFAETLVNMAALAVRFLLSPPAVIHVQYLPMLHWRLPLDYWLVRFGRRLGSKIVLTVHDLPPEASPKAHRLASGRLYRGADAIICHSDHVKKQLTAQFGVAENKIRTIPHGPFFYDLPHDGATTIRDSLGVLPGEAIVLWQGIIFPYKGVDILLDAWKRVEAAVPGARLVIAGTGAPHLLEEIRAQVARLGLERVSTLFRFVSTEELVAIYRAADVVVYPYREITTSGALATGLALGKAIIASDLPVFRELLTSGEDALLVPPQDPIRLGDAVTLLLTGQELRERLVSAVTAKDFGDQAWIGIARETMQVYREVFGDPVPGDALLGP